MSPSRGMTATQARMIAADPRTTPGVLARLANDYPEVWPVLLTNPAVSAQLRAWIEAATLAKDAAAQAAATLEVAPAQAVSPEVAPTDRTDRAPRAARPTRDRPTRERVTRERPAKPRRVRRRVPAAVVAIGILIPPLLVIAALFVGVAVAFDNRPVVGTITIEDIAKPDLAHPAWTMNLAHPGLAECMSYSFQTFDAHLGLVLMQNDISKEDCRNQDEPSPAIMAMIDTDTGAERWRVNLADELKWTKKWRASLVNAVGLDQILVKFTDTNGSDAGDEKKSIDDTDDRKMKSVVPYNPLNGRVSDTSMASMKDSPIIQAPVVQIMQLPGDTRNILIMSNGSDKSFRYAHYRAKNFTKADWSFESDLKPFGGDPIVGRNLILGREDDDDPVALNIDTGAVSDWAGTAGGKIFDVDGTYLHVTGDGTGMTLSNVQSQGGTDGHDVTLTSVDLGGNSIWSVSARGYALTTFAPQSTMATRRQYSGLYTLDGDGNRHVSRVNPSTGEGIWSTDVPANSFEISRLENSSAGIVYLTHEGDDQSSAFAYLSLANGNLSGEIPIAGSQVRVDGFTNDFAYWVDEPDRATLIADAENGRSTSHDGDDKSADTRSCLAQVVDVTNEERWTLGCNGNQHIFTLGGQWMLLDRAPQHQSLIPLHSSAGGH